MRTEVRNDHALDATLFQDSQNPILRASGTPRDTHCNKTITVAVTTAPRKDCTLAYCLASIEACGWAPIVFAEPGSTEADYHTISNPVKLGIWHSWMNASRWCLENSSNDYIMTVQDDSLFHPDCKAFVDALVWPSKAAFVSLYTPKHYSRGKPVGINRIYTKSLWGACALIWDREALKKVIETPTCKNWAGARPKSGSPIVMENRRKNPSTIANSDTAIGKAINSLALAMYFVDPSPVHHIAKFSTISHGDNTGRRNCGRCSDFSKSLREQVYP